MKFSDTNPCGLPILCSHLMRIRLSGLLILLSCAMNVMGQTHESRIASQIAGQESSFTALLPSTPLTGITDRADQLSSIVQEVGRADFYSLQRTDLSAILYDAPEHLKIDLPFQGDKNLRLQLLRADIFTSTFQVFTATGSDIPYPYEKGQYYWGIVEGKANSLVALAFTHGEIMGFIQLGDHHYTLGKIKDDAEATHILYKTDDLRMDSGISCYVDDSHAIGNKVNHQGLQTRDASNCVRMYIQVDYDVFVQKGGVQQAADYVNGAFSQVALLYANEDIEFMVNELFVWNVADPFTGPTTSNYLTQFRNYLNGNYNGDLAHLVGYNGGGGIAYLDVLCNGYYGVGYSAVNSTYNNVPNYSWTVMVLTHEIGHNLGSPHTHACAWNGNNTAIDGCGPTAGYSEGCTAPLPASGTIMSYCHLIGGVGINLNNGFGLQPGNRIRGEVYNASCLESCGPAVQYDAGITAITSPVGFPCEASSNPVVTLKNFGATTLTLVTIRYQVDNNSILQLTWTGSLSQNQTSQISLPAISYGTGPHTFKAYTHNPNGQSDEVPSNNESNSSFTYYVDWCTCNEASANLTPNPLSHSGSGSSAASVNLGAGSKRPVFTISGLNQKINGPQQSRFVDVVTVFYTDGDGNPHLYGTFSASQQSSVNVNIVDMVTSISVSLSNGLGNNGYTGTLSVSFTAVSYCAPGAGCSDEDGDGVCDDDDICAGFDDNLIGESCNDNDACTENDVYTMDCLCAGTQIPDCPGDCIETTSNFSPNPLTHVGAGQSTSIVDLPAENSDASFVISGLNSRTNGNPGNRFIEQVTVSYVNGNGNTIQHGVFRGDQVSSVEVNLPGVVQSVSLALSDAYDGNSSTQLSVSLSTVTSCTGSGALIGPSTGSAVMDARVYPNPVSGDLYVRWDQAPEYAVIRIFNALGVLVGTAEASKVRFARISLPALGLSGDQLLFISIEADGSILEMKKVMMRG